MKTKLGPKLESLFKLIPMNYDVIWDTCCDHGHLGLACLENNKAGKVIFVDQVPKIIEELSLKLDKIAGLSRERYELQSIPAQEIILENKNNLVCISGVGGEEVIVIIKNLNGKFDLHISPQYHLFEVRRFLNDIGFKMIKEELRFEGKFGRELLYLSKDGPFKIDPIGKDLFDLKDERHLNYIKGITQHLKRIKDNDALAYYEALF